CASRLFLRDISWCNRLGRVTSWPRSVTSVRRQASDVRPTLLMPKMPHPGKYHGDAVFVGGGDHLVVAHRAAGLDDAADAHLGGVVDAVPEGEEGVGGHHRALHREAGVFGFDGGDEIGRASCRGRVEMAA